MKKTILFLLAASISLHVAAQSQAETFIKEAQAFLAKKEYKQAQLSLQDAINDINTLVAKQVVESMPAEINGLKAEGEGEVNTASMGMIGGGMQISKKCSHPANKDQDAEVQILANSPMLNALNMYLTNPGMMGPGFKSVRVGTSRAILKSEMQESSSGSGKQIRSTELQVPLGQTLITIRLNGFASEQDELAFATKLEVEKIRTALGE